MRHWRKPPSRYQIKSRGQKILQVMETAGRIRMLDAIEKTLDDPAQSTSRLNSPASPCG